MRPYTIVFSTQTVDGKIADPTGFSRLSCQEDFELLHKLRAWADGIMVGARTAMVDDPSLTVRSAIGRNPVRIVLDGNLRVPPDARALSPPKRSVIVTKRGHPEEKVSAYRSRGISVIEAGSLEGVDLTEAMEILWERMNVRRLLVEGGGTTIFSLLKEGLVDELWVTVAPRIFGAGTQLVNGSPEGVSIRLYLNSYSVLCGGWVNLRYVVLDRRPLAPSAQYMRPL
ncbi:MAG: dihydrofolate reductase family protein [Acidilobus sp.]